MCSTEAKDNWLNVIENALQGESISRVIVTHHHPDHVGLAGWLCDSHRVSLYMSEAEYFYTRAFSVMRSGEPYWEAATYFDRMAIDKAQRSKLAVNDEYNEMVSNFPMSVHLLKDGDQIEIGDHQWQVITTRGHAPEHVSLYCEQQGILISGDQVLPGITSNVSVLPSIPEANPLKDWIEAHDIVAQRVPDSVTVLPAHQLPFTGLHERLQQVVEHHEHRLSELLNLCDQPRTAQDLTTMLFDRKLEPFQNFLAVGECVAHLHYLRDKNKIVRTLEGEHYLYQQVN